MSKKSHFIGMHSLLATAALLAIGVTPSAYADHDHPPVPVPEPVPVFGSMYRFGSFDGTAAQQLTLDSYIKAITSPQLDTAAIVSSTSDVAYRSYTSGSGIEGGTPVSMTRNTIAASAAGNQNGSSVDLGLAANQGGNVIGMLAGQVRSGAPAVAAVSNSTFNIRQESSYVGMPIFGGELGTGPSSAPLLIDGNTATASTTLNQSVSTVSGVLATPFASGQRGHASATVATLFEQDTTSQTDGSVTVSTAQVNQNAGPSVGSRATLGSTDVLLDVVGASTVDASVAATNNTLAAQYTGNRASSSFNALPGSAAFDGSVAVSNLQSNQSSGITGEGYYGPSAGLYDTSVTADIRSRLGTSAVLTGSLDVSGNTLSAVSTGNSATARSADGSTLAGNSISYSGTSLGGTSQSDSGSYPNAWFGALNGSADGTLALSNVQSNQGDYLASEIGSASVAGYADRVGATGTLAIDRNSIAAAVTGNLAGNRIQADAMTLAATAAASNAQSNLDTGLAAVLYGASVTAEVGTAGTLSTIGSGVTGGVTSVSSNRISTMAAGNLADTQVALSAAQVAGAGGQSAGGDTYDRFNSYASAYGDATAASTQTNLSGVVYSELQGATVAASFPEQYSGNIGIIGSSMDRGLNAASVRLDSNLLRSQAFGNDAATGVSLASTTGSASAAVANNQQNGSRIEADTRDAGVLATMGRTVGSTVGIEANTIGADAVGNRADNRVAVTATSLTPSPGSSYYGFGETYANSAGASATATHSIVSMQRNDDVVQARNTTEGAFARAELVGRETYRETYNSIWYEPAVAAVGSSISVNGNLASASATSNQVANTLGIDASSIRSTDGYATPLAALSSTQVNQAEGTSTVRVGGPAGGGAMIGAQFSGYVGGSTISVIDNTVSAVNLGNTAANGVGVTGTQYTTNSEGGTTYGLAGGAYAGSVQNDLSLVNNQIDNSNARSAVTRNVTMGVEDTQSSFGSGVYDSTLSVADNRNLAEARNNNASNSISASGFGTLSAGAGLLNTQQTSTDISTSALGRYRVLAQDTEAGSSTLSVTGNATQALTVANSVSNRATVSAVQLAPTSANGYYPDIYEGDIDSPRSGTGVDVYGALSSDAAYAVGNVQQQYGAVSATATAANRVNLNSSSVNDSTASVSGNSIAGIAQSNSAVNTLALSSPSLSGVTGSVASTQAASGSVSASAGTQSGDGAFLVKADYAAWTPMNVSNNVIRASAGQNEAFNQQVVTGTSVAGSGRAINVGETNAEIGAVWVNADHTVLNQQAGSGNVTATVTPGQIGVTGYEAYRAPLTVSGNQVVAAANVNTSSNVLSLSAQGATGVVANAQTTQAGATSAVVGGAGGTVIGTTVGHLSSATLDVSGNSLNAVAGGNNASNTLNAPGSVSAYGGEFYPVTSFAVLNQQSNSASMNAVVQSAAIGNVGTAYYGSGYGGMNQTAAAVLGNQVQAAAYGNTASNAVGLTANAGSSAMAGSMLTNRQTNNANITAGVSGVTIGVNAGYSGSSTVGITGNSISAQAIANSATNVMKIGR